MKNSRKYWIVGVIVVVIVAVVFFVNRSKSKQDNSQAQTSKVDYGTIVTSISGSGSLASQTQADVSAPGYGIIDKIYVKNGQQVKAGQVLFHYNSLASSADVAKARASFLSAQDSLNKANANLATLNSSLITAQQLLQDATKNEQILSKNAESSKLELESTKIDSKKDLEDAKKGIIDSANVQEQASTDLGISSAQSGQKSSALALDSAKIKSQQQVIAAQSTYEQAQRDADSAALKKKSAQYSYDAAKQSLANQSTTIAASQASLTSSSLALQELTDQVVTAPISGQISNLGIVENAVVGKSSSSSSSTTSSTSTSSSSSSSSSTTILSISNPKNLGVTITVNEVDIPSIKEGQSATLSFDALPGKTFIGHVSNIDYIGTTTSGVTTYNVQIILEDTDEGMRPGMSASASVITNRKDHVLLVPNSAIQTQNDQSFISVLKNGQPTTVTITTGLSNDVETEVTSGLQEGDTILVTQTSTTGGSAFSGSSGIFRGSGTRVLMGPGG